MMIYVGDSPIGRNIRYLRQKKYMSCKKLARLCGVDSQWLNLFEKGILRDISLEQWRTLSTALDADMEDLMERDLKL